MKALVEQNPELGHVISDPAFLRQSMEMMRYVMIKGGEIKYLLLQ